MRKTVKVIAILLSVAVVAAVVAVPYAVPPILERVAVEKLAALGVRAVVKMDMAYSWQGGPCLDGVMNASVPGTPWCIGARFAAKLSGCSASVSMPKTAFSETDPLVRMLLKKYPPKGISDLAFTGAVGVAAEADCSLCRPMPKWRVRVPLTDLDASMVSDGQKISVSGFSIVPGASGIADHVDIAPMFLRARAVSFGEFALTNFYATVRATEKALIVNEAGAGFCGGKANVYSLYLDPAKLDTGFTLFLENVDAGEALSHVGGFRGEATGRLHGKLRAFVKEGGRAIRLRDMFLYSTPGETGKLRMTNPETVTDNLAYAGIDDKTRGNVSDALTDLDYKVLRFDLKRTEGTSARLVVQVSGTATRGKTTVPVDLTVNFNGELEQLINTGLGYSAKLKGKKK